MGSEVLAAFEQVILENIGKVRPATTSKPVENRGKLLVDATVVEQAVRYPTDLSQFNEAQENSKQLIDELHGISDLSKKPRTYRQKA